MTDVSAPTGHAVRDGLAPRGMLWVAWRQRRSLILITLGLYAAAAVTIVVRSLLRGRDLAAAGVDDLAACANPGMTSDVLAGCERWLALQSSWATWDSQINSLPTVICVLFGLGLGAAAVGHEFERGVSSFSFTQSISPMRWAAAQLAVVAGSSSAGVLVLDAIGRVLADGRHPTDGSGGSFDTTSLWPRPLLIIAMICVAFVLSIVSRSSSGGFWGGLGLLVVTGIVINFLSRSTVTSSPSDPVTCPNDTGEVCGRILVVVFRFRALAVNSGVAAGPVWAIALITVGLVSLLGGFLLLRRRFR